MRGFLPNYRLRSAARLDDVLAVMAAEPGSWRLFAGGTDLMVLLEAGKLPPCGFLSVWNIPELRGIEVTADRVVLGALTTYTDVLQNRTLATEFPLLGEAARQTGGVATQNRGTIGGNIANASPAADTPPALLVYDAEVELVSVRGTRRVPYDSFHRGYKIMDLAADEIIRAVSVPRNKRTWRQRFRKVGARRAQAISKVCFAGAIHMDGVRVRDVRIAFGSVAPTVVRCRAVEDVLRGAAADEATIARAVAALDGEISPIDDIRSTAAYRRRVAHNLLKEFLSET